MMLLDNMALIGERVAGKPGAVKVDRGVPLDYIRAADTIAIA